MEIDIHVILHLSGLITCIGASIYLIYKKQKQIGSFLLIGFIFILQSNLYIALIGLDPLTGECWARQGDFAKCQPFVERLSFHMGQLGFFLLALGILLLGLKQKKHAEVTKTGS